MSAAHKVEVAVVGAGVIGLACARHLAKMGKEVIILERAEVVGSGISSRNSEVIHAGIYYPPNSMKSKVCVRGRKLLYDYCKSRSIPHDSIGKLVVSVTEEQKQKNLPQIMTKAKLNGVNDLRLLSVEDIGYLEPEIRCTGGFYSPSTGIVDSHELMMSLLGDAEESGATLALRCRVEDAYVSDPLQHGIVLKVGDTDLLCENVVNCAGLFADQLCNLIVGKHRNALAPPASVPRPENDGSSPGDVSVTRSNPRQYFAKGNYFKLEGCKPPFHHLVYPIPEAGGLGIHATLDLAGSCRFGPDVEWVDPSITNPDDIDITVNPDRAGVFYDQIRKYWPGLRDDALVPDYAGVRPKLGHPDILESPSIQADFVLEGARDHGIPGFINMLGIESPGLTSSMALAEHIADTLHQ